MSGWIDNEAGDWKKADKLRNRLNWIEGRMRQYLDDGCYEKAPDANELEAIDEVSLKLIYSPPPV